MLSVVIHIITQGLINLRQLEIPKNKGFKYCNQSLIQTNQEPIRGLSN